MLNVVLGGVVNVGDTIGGIVGGGISAIAIGTCDAGMIAGAAVGAGIGRFASGVYAELENIGVVEELNSLAKIIKARRQNILMKRVE